MMDLSIIIVNWNTGPLLRECIASIYDTLRAHTFEIIVVDNASTDSSAHGLGDQPNLHVLLNNRNVGFAAANNQGFACSLARYLFMLNPDTVALPEAIDCLINYLDLHPRVGAVGPRLLSPNGLLQLTCSHYPSLPNAGMEALGLSRLFPRSRFFARTAMTYWSHDSERQVEVICGAALMIRRNALEAVGYLDERFYVYFEETDLCLRLTRAGWPCYFMAAADIIHLGGQSSLRNLDVRIVARYRSLLAFYRKHYPRWHEWVLRGLLIFEMMWRFIALFITGIRSLRSKSRGEVMNRYLQVLRLCLSAR